MGPVSQISSRSRRRSSRSATFEAKVAALPRGPGVYVFLGRHGLPIYVGKSVNLQRRVRQHLGGGESVKHHAREMASGIGDLRAFPTETELHALLLEDELIKTHRPPYNRQQKKYLLQRYLALRPGPGLGLSVVERAEADDGAGIFGPFGDEHYAARLARFVERYFDDAPSAARFLRGESQGVTSIIAAEIARHVDRLAFELAAAARDRLHLCQGFLEHQRHYRAFREGLVVVSDEANASFFCFVRGHLRGFWRAPPTRGELGRLRAARAEADEPDWKVYDRARLVRAWVASRPASRSWSVR